MAGRRRPATPIVSRWATPFGEVSIASYAGHAVNDAPYGHSEGPYPSVILPAGFALGASNYAWLAEHLGP